LLGPVNHVSTTSLEECQVRAAQVIEQMLNAKEEDIAKEHGGMALFSSALQLVLVLRGDEEQVDQLFQQSVSIFVEKDNLQGDERNNNIILACAIARKQLDIRRIDSYRQVVSSPLTTIASGGGRTGTLPSFLSDLVALLKNMGNDEGVLSLVSVGLSCCQELADGENALKFINWILQKPFNDLSDSPLLQDTLESIERVGRLSTVRVINLEMRQDRMAAFMAQARHEQLLVVRGVSGLDAAADSDNYFCGKFALDGQGRPAEVETCLRQLVGGEQRRLNELVETHWCPNDLKPFDVDAPSSEDLVRISPSEKACALSHIATWRGVVRSLNLTRELLLDGSSGTESESVTSVPA
jgi:hypothetical protein